MKKKILFISIFINILLLAFSGNYYSESYFYSVDYPNNWKVQDDGGYNVLFASNDQEAFAEVTVFKLSSASSNQEFFDIFKKRFGAKGEATDTTFCRYKAKRGTLTLIYEDSNMTMDMIVFKDKYFYYVIMGYGYTSNYSSHKNELYNIVESLKLYYDNDVVYGNDENSNQSHDNNENQYSDATNNYTDEQQSKISSEEYPIHLKWENYSKDFAFLKSDLENAVAELNNIVNTGIWTYYNVDTQNDPDYNLHFWQKFYQDMFKKNYNRTNSIVKWFKNELNKNGWSSYKLAEEIMKCIQGIDYARPKNISEAYSKGATDLDYFSPNEVAYFHKGDCDTKSLFMVILLRHFGYDAVMYYSSYYGHAMVGLNINTTGTYKTYKGKKYYFIESTYPGWNIGDLPSQMGNTSYWNIMPIF